MKSIKIHPVIMAGGSGTRLWPLSTKLSPKQFQCVISQKTMLQETLLRFVPSVEGALFQEPTIVGNESYKELIQDDLININITPRQIILEPEGRNTAAVAAMAALLARNDDELILLLPSDLHMTLAEDFRNAVSEAAEIAMSGKIVTFGILPRTPHTGYGYIQQGEPIKGRIYNFERFVEKPDPQTAQTYLDSGDYSWNGGMFLFKPSTMLAELSAFAADIVDNCKLALQNAQKSNEVITIKEEDFKLVRSDSIDYAIMEKTSKGAVYAPLECGWDDIGSWAAVSELKSKKPTPTNTLIEIDSMNCFVHKAESTIVALVDVQDLIVVEHKGRILIMSSNSSQKVKDVVQLMKQHGLTEHI